MASPPAELAGPTAAAQRIDALDTLRGLAILGILVMNVQAFSMPLAAYIDPTAWGDLRGVNFLVWLLSHVFFAGKFIAIFSMLFGAGIVLMAQRQASRGARPGPVHYRRMAWLLAFGLLHGFAIWYGDILATYALCGMAVFLLWRVRPMFQLALGVVLYLVPAVWTLLFALSAALDGTDGQPVLPMADTEAELVAYRGGWLEQMAHRLPTTLHMLTFDFAMYFAWGTAGLMLMGMALFKWRVLTGQAENWTYRQLLLVAACVGLPIIGVGLGVTLPRGFGGASLWLNMALNHIAAPLVALGWVSVLMLALPRAGGVNPGRAYLMRSPGEGEAGAGDAAPPRWALPLAAVGRMALTNYLLQSVICTFIFYGHGLGHFGQVERIEQAAVVLAVWAGQLIWSPLWLSAFNHGPVEWLWRALTYRRWPAMRR